MPINSTEYENLIRRPSRYTADKHKWLDFAPDGSFDHDIIADQLDELYTAMRDGMPTAEEAATALIEIFASDFTTPLKAKG